MYLCTWSFLLLRYLLINIEGELVNNAIEQEMNFGEAGNWT